MAGQLGKRLAERMLAAEMSHHPEAGTEQGKANLSAFLWARRLNNRLSARLRKSLAEQDSKLVHR
ncbi:hypothetical protein TQ36_22990 [Burkholderia cenocepacia]|nr:hypothetical protein TQ36_22990 [Burkholderia cenocepacia]